MSFWNLSAHCRSVNHGNQTKISREELDMSCQSIAYAPCPTTLNMKHFNSCYARWIGCRVCRARNVSFSFNEEKIDHTLKIRGNTTSFQKKFIEGFHSKPGLSISWIRESVIGISFLLGAPCNHAFGVPTQPASLVFSR
jgi:hypothetical protein